MRVLIDAQLPQRLAHLFAAHDFDSKHTLDLPDKNATTDHEIIRIADQENRIIVTKDSDFLDNYILENKPQKLLIVAMGNIKNDNLLRIFEQNIDTLQSLFEEHAVIEIDEYEIQTHF